MEFESLADNQIALARGKIGIAVHLLHLIHDIRSQFRIEQGRAGIHRGHMIGNRRERFVLDFDESRRVFREIAIYRDNQGHRLPDIANPCPWR